MTHPDDHQSPTEEACRRPKRVSDWMRIGAGLLLFLLGVAGLVLPILQGVLFLMGSAVLLAPYSAFVQRQQARLEARYPTAAGRAREWLGRLKQRLGRHG